MSTALRIEADRVWTVTDLEQLPEDVDWRRFEIVDGALVVSPQASPLHERFVVRLAAALLGSAPAGWDVIGAAAIDLSRSYRITDVTVVADRVFARGSEPVSPSDVLLAVEIESPSSITTDRVTKPAQYAAAGIVHYWRLETDPLRLHTYRLSGDRYEQTGSWDADGVAHVSEPFVVDLDLGRLLP